MAFKKVLRSLKEEEPEGPLVERKCSQCNNDAMSYSTLQLRSADEGQTIFYTCTKCKSKCKQFARNNNFGIRCKLFGTNPMCHHCCTLWTDGRYQLRILPKKATHKRMKKILYKNLSSPELLTSYERKLLANYEKKNHNKMELVCSVCCKKTVILMKKIDRNIKVDDDSSLQEDRKKKKKKPKDPFAGLKRSAVLAVNNTVMKTKVKKGTEVKKNIKIPKKTLAISKPKNSQVELLPKEFRRKDTLQRILGSSQSGVQSSTSRLQNFLAGLK